MVSKIVKLYGVEGDRHESLISLAREAHERGWWEDLGVFNGSYVGLEDAASLICAWEPQLVPGLLQTEDYARAMIEVSIPDLTASDIERRVKARVARQTLLSRPNAPEFQAIIGEAVLRQQVGGPDVLREQMQQLLAIARRRPNVSVRVLPFSAGASIGLDGAFTYLEFPESIDPAVSYIEDISGETYIESAEGNRRTRLAFERIADAALSPADSATLIADVAKE